MITSGLVGKVFDAQLYLKQIFVAVNYFSFFVNAVVRSGLCQHEFIFMLRTVLF